MVVATITTVILLFVAVTGLFLLMFMFLDVSIFTHNSCFESTLTESPRPPYLRGSYVRDLPTSKEDATHKDYAYVVQTVNSMVSGFF